MYIRFTRLARPGQPLAMACALWLGLLGLPQAHAQPTPPLVSYSSALDNYPFANEVEAIDWKTANDTVAKRGGWRAYANEAAAKASTSGGKQ